MPSDFRNSPEIIAPKESFPEIGTIANPVVLYDGEDAFVCYEASHRAGGGNVLVKFTDVIDFRVTPGNVEGLGGFRYPVKAWAFCEIVGGEETVKWKALKPRFCIMSFNDVMIEVVFIEAFLIVQDKNGGNLLNTLLRVSA